MKYLFLIFSVLLIADESRVTVEQLFSVKLTKVQKVTTTKVEKNYGYVRVDETARYSVTPRFGGFIEVLYADSLYKYVQKGEALVKVYSPEVLRAKEEYLASLKYSKKRANAQMLRSSLDKLLLLHVEQDEIKNIKKLYKVSNFTTIRAPKSGYIFSKNISNLDAFKSKQKLFEIVDLDSVWVEMTLHQKDIKNLESMETFSVKTIGIQQKYSAKKGVLYPAIKEGEATLTLRLHVENKKHLLKSGMYVSVDASAKEEEYLTLPTTAVIRKNGAFYAFVAGEYEGEYEPTPLHVKVLNADTYIVMSGVTEGDEVVNHALFMMDSDAQINGLY